MSVDRTTQHTCSLSPGCVFQLVHEKSGLDCVLGLFPEAGCIVSHAHRDAKHDEAYQDFTFNGFSGEGARPFLHCKVRARQTEQTDNERGMPFIRFPLPTNCPR